MSFVSPLFWEVRVSVCAAAGSSSDRDVAVNRPLPVHEGSAVWGAWAFSPKLRLVTPRLSLRSLQIHLLVTSLNKKNAKISVGELTSLVGLYGTEAGLFLFASLLHELDAFLREGKALGSPSQVRKLHGTRASAALTSCCVSCAWRLFADWRCR